MPEQDAPAVEAGKGHRRGRSLYFQAPNLVGIVDEAVPRPGPGHLVVRSLLSGISAGTEMMVYRGDAPREAPIDTGIPALTGRFGYPMKYGYALVGEVVEAGPDVSRNWLGQKVFAFHPHESLFVASPAELIALPAGIGPEDALFLAAAETAVTLVHDGRPLWGEKVAVFGQGVVGLLLTAALSAFPLDSLVTFDRYRLRREASRRMGAHESLDPRSLTVRPGTAHSQLSSIMFGLDLLYEVSGNPEALMLAVDLAGFESRIVIGSWYREGTIENRLDLRFHRNRVSMTSSQVSTMASGLTGRWTRERRLEAAWDAIRRARPSALISHRFPIAGADRAYDLLARDPGDALQVILTY